MHFRKLRPVTPLYIYISVYLLERGKPVFFFIKSQSVIHIVKCINFYNLISFALSVKGEHINNHRKDVGHV